MSFTTSPSSSVPHLDVNGDTGSFVHAVAQRPAGGHYMAAGAFCSWSDYMRIWAESTSQKAFYKQVSLEEMIEMTPDREFGREVGDMFAYCNDPGYDGGMDLITAEDLRKVSLELGLPSLLLTRDEGWYRLSNDHTEGIQRED